jgi:hypothetical protein
MQHLAALSRRGKSGIRGGVQLESIAVLSQGKFDELQFDAAVVLAGRAFSSTEKAGIACPYVLVVEARAKSSNWFYGDG